MKRAIFVKFISATNTKPARLKAFDGMRNNITVCYHSLDSEGETKYLEMAQKLCKKMNWIGKLRGGWHGNIGVFVFID
jgi:hypothetical protein